MRPIFENWLIENGFDAKYTLMILDELSLWLKSSGKIILNLYDSISDPCIFSSFIENILDSNEDALVAHYDEPAIDIIRLNTNLFKMFLNDCLDKNGIDGPFNNAFNGQINENREGMYDEKLDIKVTPPINIEAINADLDFRDNFNTDIVTNKNELESNPLKDNYSNTYLNNNNNSSNELSKSNDDYGFADSHELKHQDLHEIKKESDLDKLIVSNGSARDLTESNVISAISKKNNLSQNELNSEINESNLIEQPKIISNSRQKFIQWISLHKNSEFSSGKIIDCFDKTSTYLSNKKLSCDIYEIQSVNQFAKIAGIIKTKTNLKSSDRKTYQNFLKFEGVYKKFLKSNHQINTKENSDFKESVNNSPVTKTNINGSKNNYQFEVDHENVINKKKSIDNRREDLNIADAIKWLTSQPNRDGNLYLERVLRTYFSTLSTVPSQYDLDGVPNRNVFSCHSVDELDMMWDIFKTARNFKEIERARSVSKCIKVLRRYIQYLTKN